MPYHFNSAWSSLISHKALSFINISYILYAKLVISQNFSCSCQIIVAERKYENKNISSVAERKYEM